jgi:hypothetical protein
MAKMPAQNDITSKPGGMSTPPKSKVGSPGKKTTLPESEKKKKIVHRIITLFKKDELTAVGFAFDNYYDRKEYIKSLPNRIGATTKLGGLTLKPYINLTNKWIANSDLGPLLWVIHIDDTKEDLEGNFPTSASVTYANKIACGIIAQKILGKMWYQS